MEEDIKILESYLDRNTQLFEDYGDTAIIQDKEIQAIENLIKGYRELEEKLDNSRKANELLNKTNNELRLEIRTTYSKVVNDIISKFNLGDDYIPKSKVQEKLEELDKKIKKIENKKVWNEPADTIIRNRLCNYYNALKELMEDK